MSEAERLRREQEAELAALERGLVERAELEAEIERLLRDALLAEQVEYNPTLPPAVRERAAARRRKLSEEAEALRRRLDEAG